MRLFSVQLLQPLKRLSRPSMAGIIRGAINVQGFRAEIRHLLCVTVDIPQRLRFIGPVPFRYKIEIEVTYAGKCCKFVFWDRECVQLLGVFAAQMCDVLATKGITNPLEFPLALDAILNLELAFKVKWQPRWESCSVVMFLRDDAYIKQLKSPWEVNQATTCQPPTASQATTASQLSTTAVSNLSQSINTVDVVQYVAP